MEVVASHNVSRSTAYRRVEEPDVTACASAIRRRALHRAVGLRARRITWVRSMTS